jgi:hypothetical protein
MKLKNKFFRLAYFSLTLVFTTYGRGDKHKEHNSLADNFTHKDIVILDHPYQLGEAARTELEHVIDDYLQVKDALVIQNPYMGAKMPTCGEVKEEL